MVTDLSSCAVIPISGYKWKDLPLPMFSVKYHVLLCHYGKTPDRARLGWVPVVGSIHLHHGELPRLGVYHGLGLFPTYLNFESVHPVEPYLG